MVRAKAPSPLRFAGAVHNEGASFGVWRSSPGFCLSLFAGRGVVESARQGISDTKRCSHIGGTSSTSPTSIVVGDDLPARNERVGLSELVPPSFWNLSGIWILAFGISRASRPDSLWTSRPRSCTILFMGVWFPFIDDQARQTPLILRIGRHTPVTRANQPKSNTHSLPLRSHRV